MFFVVVPDCYMFLLLFPVRMCQSIEYIHPNIITFTAFLEA